MEGDLSLFKLNPSLIPSYIPLRVAEKVRMPQFYNFFTFLSVQILFIGEAVQIFSGRNPHSSDTAQPQAHATEVEQDSSASQAGK